MQSEEQIGSMNFARLEKNVTDVIIEEQIKLGYRRERIRLYYPLASLNVLLETDCNIAQMTKALQIFSDVSRTRLGEIEISNRGERFCLSFPEQAAVYVHGCKDDHAFLEEFIGAVSGHDNTLQDIFDIFHKHSPHVVIEEAPIEDFDYLVYFSDGIPDDYRYCLTDEGAHIIYHRFTPEDYAALLAH